MKKTAIAALVVLIVLAGLSACTGDERETETPTPPPLPTQPPPTVTPVETPQVSDLPLPEETAPPVSEAPVVTTPPPAPTATPPVQVPPTDFKVVGYITHWRMHRLKDIDLSKVTHVIWQGVEVTSSTDSTLRVAADADWDQLPTLVKAAHKAGTKVMASLIGFWDETELDQVWESPSLRAELVENLETLVEEYGLDGIDVDNEGSCHPENYSVFVRELREALGPDRIVSIAANPYGVCIDPKAVVHLDFINMMSYDMFRGTGYPYHSTMEESVAALELWADAGVPEEKLLMGIPFYGRDGKTAHFEYWWIVEKYSPLPHQNQVSEPTAAGGIIWWNGEELVREKVKYILDNGFGGVMIYELGNDSTGEHSLLLTLFEILRTGHQAHNFRVAGGT